MKINALLVPILMIGTILGVVGIAQATGNWTTSGREGVDLESFAPADIKGWMTLEQISVGVGIPLGEMYTLVGIPAETAPTTAIKEMEEVVEVSTLREALAAWQAGEPWPPVEATPAEASAPAATPAPAATVAATAVPPAEPTATHAPGSGAGDGSGVGPTPLPAGQILPASSIKGKMTLAEVSAQCAVPLDQVLAGLNLPANTNPNTLIKDLVANGLLTEVTQVQQVVAGLQK